MPRKPSETLTEEADITTRRGSRSMPKSSPMPKRSSTRLSEIDGLDNPERVRLLGIIDQFRELGVSEDISLPQLVVVGDQSSGKSSLLEGLTGLAFPIASDLCTRFATQIVLRRTPKEQASIKISIIPGPEANSDDDIKFKLLNFAHTLASEEFDCEIFPRIINEAAECMGLPTSDTADIENLSKRFSDDVLKIEISGPAHHHLSVVDVPGLFHNPTKHQTKEDSGIIRALIETYITDPRTIIMAVMDARNNFANQEVFRMARAADPQGLRTVGIITKCDAVQTGDEPGVLKIAQNKTEHLTHGWFCVKNRSTKEIEEGVTIEARHVNEKAFFKTHPWNELRKDHVGIGALKGYLGQLLYKHVRDEFPGLVKELRQLVEDANKERDALGPARQTPVEQRQYLTRLAGKYQHAVGNALLGNYAVELNARALKLRMLLQNLNEAFGKRIAKEGHTKAFLNIDGSADVEFHRRKEDDQEGIGAWIKKIYQESRGAELPGTVNPAVLESMFRQQTVNWKPIAVEHLDEVEKAVHKFNDLLIKETLSDNAIRSRMIARLEPKWEISTNVARAQLYKILDDERAGILQTVNDLFAQSLAGLRKDRVLARLNKAAIGDNLNEQGEINIEKLAGAVHLSNDDQAVDDIHDILKSYYKVALKRFVDNVVVQVVERQFLGHDGPVKLLCPEYVGALSDSELKNIAGEDFATSITRTEINSKIERLQKALRIVGNYWQQGNDDVVSL